MSDNLTVDLEFNELAKLVAGKKEVIVALKNGYQMRGVITDYDSNVILFKSEKKTCMIYRQALSTITLSEGKR